LFVEEAPPRVAPRRRFLTTRSSRTSRLESIKRLFRREESSLASIADGGTPVATPPPGASRRGDPDRETSTDAQTEGAADEPWDAD
jgi:hypothetical protein